MVPLPRSLQGHQAVLCLLLLLGLAVYLAISLFLRTTGSIQDPENLAALDKAALQFFVPYLGLAVGGLFGTGRVSPTVEPSLYRFGVAATTLVVWDLLVTGQVLLILLGKEYVEDFLAFADTTLQVLSPLVAAIMAYYFGAHGAEPDRKGSEPAVAGTGA